MIRITDADKNHWHEIKRIYIEGIETKNATFETVDQIPDCETWFDNKIPGSVFTAMDGNKVIGWSALLPVSKRKVYSGVAEVSVYVSKDTQGKGAGKLLLQKLIDFSESNNIWTLQAGIFPENKISISLHEKLGFRIVGVREKLGQVDGRWRDVVLMERRSRNI